ncbi:GH1 family beta-glucosidase [Cellulomonas soli]|uniref:Beta-glucosidase n=1 Tax=Cellulomonas soli TaxID=931535 RepID=A0A512PCN3_9CELL|nr:GH1 family beta-glucosidase [Cellulomonas soli]NYI58460.1 beta-glucosidase [Cellulomonas soli]GEP68882.1 beta-glucosidase [Cellulomonas soli]
MFSSRPASRPWRAPLDRSARATRREGPELDRRTVLAFGGAAVGAVVLGGCTGGGPTGVSSLSPSTGWAPPAEPMSFPTGYTWGAATSAFQVEGSTTADGRGPSVWDTFCAQPGRVKGGATGDPGADGYRRWQEDVALMSELGIGAYRFSVAWPRIQPTGSGPVNQPGLDWYRRFVDSLLDAGIRPAVTLFHWDLPQALQDAGGWAVRDTAARFADYATVMFDALGDAEADWFTINEPKTHAYVGHWYGSHAPGLHDPQVAVAAVHHQLLAHGLAVERFREQGTTGRIGIALNLMPVYPQAGAEEAATRVDAAENRLFLDAVLTGEYPDDAVGPLPGQVPADPEEFAALVQDGDMATIGAPTDLLAVQYYGVTGVAADGSQVAIHPTSAASWQQLWPEGLYDLLVRLRDEYPAIPLLITENGIPDETADLTTDDPYRTDYLREHFQQAARAIADGVPLEAHYVWSLLDNFEWAEGYQQRWGIVAVDFDTQERTPKDSFGFYRGVIAANAVAPA